MRANTYPYPNGDAETADILKSLFTITSVGVAMLGMLEELVPDAAASVETASQELSKHFLVLKEHERLQDSILKSLLEQFGSITADGETMPLESFISLVAYRLTMTMQKNLRSTQYAENALRDMENSLNRLHAIKHEVTHLGMKNNKKVQSFCTMVESSLDVTLANITKVRHSLGEFILSDSEEFAYIKDMEVLEQIMQEIRLRNTEFNSMHKKSAAAAKSAMDAASDILVDLQFQDRNSQVMEDVGGLLCRLRIMLEQLQGEAAVMRSDETPGGDGVAKIIDSVFPAIRLNDVRTRFLEVLHKAGMADKPAQPAADTNHTMIELF